MSLPAKFRAGLMIILCGAFCQVARAGYDVHITRAQEWTESEKTPVSAAEWIQLARNDGEFRVVPPDDPKEMPKDAIWIRPDDKEEVYFYYFRGRIVVKDPDERIIAKMKRVAAKLRAKVIGDDGEEYGDAPTAPI